jgi:hypothetical protein
MRVKCVHHSTLHSTTIGEFSLTINDIPMDFTLNRCFTLEKDGFFKHKDYCGEIQLGIFFHDEAKRGVTLKKSELPDSSTPVPLIERAQYFLLYLDITGFKPNHFVAYSADTVLAPETGEVLLEMFYTPALGNWNGRVEITGTASFGHSG